MPDAYEAAATRLLLLGINYAPEQVGIAVYSTGMAEWLAARGHSVEVIAGQPYYPGWTISPAYRGFLPKRTVESGVGVTRCPLYVPARPTGARRVLHHFSFALSALCPTLWRGLRQRPQTVFVAAPSLISAPVGWFVARLLGAKAWLHIQDFEVEAAFSTGLLKSTGLAATLARGFERWVMRRFDIVSSISPMMCRKLEAKGVPADRIVEFRNWADIAGIAPLQADSPYRRRWNIATPHVALYSGNIANKQGIEIVVEAARLLAPRKDLTFVICGEGPNRAALEALAGDAGNIQFHDLQPKSDLSDLVGLASVHLLPQVAGAADLVLPSKLNNMLASGRPVVATASYGTGLAAEVEGCGIVVEPGDAEAFAAAIVQLLDDPDHRAALGATARRRATERWDPEQILGRVETRLRQSGERSSAVGKHATP
ncbi:MAG: WcaI family glycosyltransferase [Devosia sp.]